MIETLKAMSGRSFLVIALALVALGAGTIAGIQALTNTGGQQKTAVCDDGIIIWANGQTGMLEIDKSGQNNTINGHIWSNNDILISGSNTTITGAPHYVTTFTNSGGTTNVYQTPVNVTAQKTPPVTFDIADYAPGGAKANEAAGNVDTSALTAPANVGNYHLRSGEHTLTSSEAAGGGLFYVTEDSSQKANFLVSTQSVGSTGITMVAEKTISISGSNTGFDNPFSGSLLLMSGLTDKTSNFVIKVEGSGSTYNGAIYALTGLVQLAGSHNTFNGMTIGQRVQLNGSNLTFNFDGGVCPEDPTATPTSTSTETETATATATETATATATGTETATATPTNTDEPTVTPTNTDEPTATPTITPSSTDPVLGVTVTPGKVGGESISLSGGGDSDGGVPMVAWLAMALAGAVAVILAGRAALVWSRSD